MDSEDSGEHVEGEHGLVEHSPEQMAKVLGFESLLLYQFRLENKSYVHFKCASSYHSCYNTHNHTADSSPYHQACAALKYAFSEHSHLGGKMYTLGILGFEIPGYSVLQLHVDLPCVT